MIRNLNQVNFCSYGSVLPERAHASLPFSREDADLTALDSDCAPIYMTHSETWLSGSSGMAILSICARKDEYLHLSGQTGQPEIRGTICPECLYGKRQCIVVCRRRET